MPQSTCVAIKSAILILFLINASFAWAGDREFHCIVKKIYYLNLKGELEKEAGFSVSKVNDAFFVDRATGVVIGEHMPVFRPDRFNFLTSGRDGNAFVISYSGRIRIGFLRIENFRNEAQSPFLISDGIWVAAGICN